MTLCVFSPFTIRVAPLLHFGVESNLPISSHKRVLPWIQENESTLLQENPNVLHLHLPLRVIFSIFLCKNLLDTINNKIFYYFKIIM